MSVWWCQRDHDNSVLKRLKDELKNKISWVIPNKNLEIDWDGQQWYKFYTPDVTQTTMYIDLNMISKSTKRKPHYNKN